MKERQSPNHIGRPPLRDLLLLLCGAAVTAGVAWLSSPVFVEGGRLAQVLIGMVAGLAMAALWFWVRRARRAAGPRTEPLAAFPDLAPNPVLEAGFDGTVYYANPAAVRLFPDLIQKGARHPLLGDIRELLNGVRSQRRRHVFREVQVAECAYEQHVVAMPDTDRVRIYVFDITKRKHAAEARQQSEEKFARVFRSAPMAISISRLADGRFIDANDSFVRLLGYTDRHALVGQTAPEIGMWAQRNDRARILELLSQEDGAVHSLETQIRRRDGTSRDVIMSVELMEFDGEPCVLSTMLDVTERNQAEAGIAILKAFYEDILRELPIEVAVLDDQARFFYLNPTATRDEELRVWMVGKTLVDFAHATGADPALFERRHRWVLDVIASKQPGQLEESFTTSDGEQRNLLRVATPVLDEDGTVIYVVGFGIDITERTLFERQLMEAKNAAEELAHLKSAFLANMSHEVRTPLTAILGFATVLAEELGGEQRDLLEIIKHSGERLLETLNSVLDLARLEANALKVDPKPLDLEEELLAAARLYRPLAQKKGLVFKMEMPRRTLRAQLDRACLHRVLSNLLSNAVKFTDAGEIRLALRPAAHEVQIEVSDTGIGIDETFLPYLFEEFKQESTGLARTHTGSGLGLAITRHLVEQMHGRIEVASRKDEGSTFIVTFPAMATPPVCVTGPEEAPAGQAVYPDEEAVGS